MLIHRRCLVADYSAAAGQSSGISIKTRFIFGHVSVGSITFLEQAKGKPVGSCLDMAPSWLLAGYNGRDSVSATRSEDSWMTTMNFHGLRWSDGLFCRSKLDPRSLMRFTWSCGSCNKDAESPTTVHSF